MRDHCLAVLLLGAGASFATSANTLQPDDLVETITLGYFGGPRFSPDGELAMLDVASSTETLEFDFPSQRYTATGYPVSGASIYRAHVLDMGTGELTRLVPGPGISWGGSWSPDGQLYAFYSDRTGEPRVWLWERSKQEARLLDGPVVRVSLSYENPVWSPDGKSILYKAVPEGMTRRDLDLLHDGYRRWQAAGSTPSKRDENAVEVTVQSTFADRTAAEEGHGPSQGSAPTDTGLRLPVLYQHLRLADLVTVNVETSSVVHVAKRINAYQYSLSPNGKWIAALDTLGLDGRGLMQYALRLYPIDGGGARTLDANVAITNTYSFFSWSPRSDRIAYVSWSEHHGNAHVYVTRLDGVRVEASAPLGQQRMHFPEQAPAWSADGRSFYLVDNATAGSIFGRVPTGKLIEFSSDGRRARKLIDVEGRPVRSLVLQANRRQIWSPNNDGSLVVVMYDQESSKEGFQRFERRSERLVPIAEWEASVGSAMAVVPGRASRLVYEREDATRPSDLWTLDVVTGETRQLTQFHPRLVGKAMGRPRLIEWISARGERLKGALLLPPHYEPGKRYPLLVQIYGGIQPSQSINRFGMESVGSQTNAQLFAAHGYAVLQPDIPLHEFTPMKDYSSAVLPAVDKVIELGIADPEKLAVTGQSFGGYGTLALLVQTTRFKAAIATNSAPSNFFAAYSSTDMDWTNYYEHGQSRMGGTPWQQPTRYMENSPFFYFDRVTTPLLIQRGDKDAISADSGAVFNSLKRLKKDVVLLEYAQEGHALQRPQHIVDYWKRVYEFLDRYIDPTPR